MSEPTPETLLGHIKDRRGAHEAFAIDVDGEPLLTHLAGQYATLAGDFIFIPATQFVATAGSPLLSGDNAQGPGWLLDGGSTNESIGCVAPPFPAWWSTFSVSLYWSNAGAGSGDVRLNWIDGGADIGFADGDTVAYAFDAVVTLTAPAQDVLKVSELVATRTIVAAHPLNIFRLDRVPGDAADTLTNDMRVYGIRLDRLS